MNKIKLLIAQPEPENVNLSYTNLAEKYNLEISFIPFISITGLDKNAFNAQKIKIHDHTAVIFSSRNSIDHFFRMCSVLKISITSEMKYFCSSEHIANYLQKYIITKKRMITIDNGPSRVQRVTHDHGPVQETVFFEEVFLLT